MSLRGKIVLLFLGLAIVPLLIVAGFGYWQASNSAREVVGLSLDASAAEVARELREGLDGAERKVRELAADETMGYLVASRDFQEIWENEVEATLPPLAFVSVRAQGMGQIAQAGSRPDEAWRCTEAGGARLHTIDETVRTGGRDVQIEAGVWLDDLVSPEPPRVAESMVVFSRGEGTAVLSTSCADFDGGVPAALAAAVGTSGRLRFERDDQERLASLATAQESAWSVVAHTRSDTFLGPLQQLQASYWAFVLTLALATALAFSLLLNRVVMSLEELTAAAARIGDGELNPWLPPPGEDEVGRLSLAFSGMLERIRQMMQRIDHSGRLAVVGQLTSYLAHEIRNPLSSIRMNLQSLQRDVRRGRIPEDAGEAIDISLREVDRLSGSLTSVLQLGRPTSGPRETVSVHDVVKDAADLLTGEFKRCEVRLRMELDATADRVTAAPGQLKGVFLNLMMNALEAQPDGGRLEIRSRLVSAPGHGPIVAVHLRDHGRGVPPELRARIFEPFFTTKSQGSGIGLAVALRTVREHGGNLFLTELPESTTGSELVVQLPLAAVVADTIPEPEVDLPAWMGTDEASAEGGKLWPKGRSKRGGAPGRTLTERSESDYGKLH